MNIPRFTVTRDETPAPVRHNRGHFRFNTISAFLILIFLVAGLASAAHTEELPDFDKLWNYN